MLYNAVQCCTILYNSVQNYPKSGSEQIGIYIWSGLITIPKDMSGRCRWAEISTPECAYPKPPKSEEIGGSQVRKIELTTVFVVHVHTVKSVYNYLTFHGSNICDPEDSGVRTGDIGCTMVTTME